MKESKILPTVSAGSLLAVMGSGIPLPRLANIQLLSVKNQYARQSYETEVLRGGCPVRQLAPQINS